ncbi:MAG TPA: hypothetical protein VIK26_05495 [Clostridium sp.]
MRKITSLVLFCFILLFLSACQNNQNSKYPMYGRDTYKAFGDGRFAILISEKYAYNSPEYNPNTNTVYSLFDQENQQTIEISVYKYKEIESYLYIVGESGYTLVNYISGQIEQHNIIDKFSQDVSKIFKDESNYRIIP